MISSHNYVPIIKNRLDKFGLDGTEFCQKLIECKCVIAGSFTLQCLLDETYEESDIDIFVPYDRKSYSNPNTYRCQFEKWIHKEYNINSKPEIYCMRDVIASKKYQINHKTCINIILVDTNDVEEYIKNDFDLSFCQTIFDGKEMKYWDMTLHKVGFISNTRQQKVKNGYHLTQIEAQTELDRLDQRFHPIHSNISLEDEKNFIKSRIYVDPIEELQQRMEKYKSRGFTILNPHDSKLIITEIKLRDMQCKYSSLLELHEKTIIEINKLKDKLSTINSICQIETK